MITAIEKYHIPRIQLRRCHVMLRKDKMITLFKWWKGGGAEEAEYTLTKRRKYSIPLSYDDRESNYHRIKISTSLEGSWNKKQSMRGGEVGDDW